MNWVCRLNHRRREDCGIECLRNQVAGLELDIAVYKRDAENAGRVEILLREQVAELTGSIQNLVNVKGRHHTEQAYKQLEALLAKARTAQFASPLAPQIDTNCLRITED